MSAVDHTTEPMLAKAVGTVPVGGGLSYEPKWDGFRAIVAVTDVDGQPQVEIGSRGGKTLTRYFPELVDQFREQVPVGAVVDGEIVVRRGEGGARLDWESLSQRIHPADSRVQKLAVETPASFIAFDLLAAPSGTSLLDAPFAERRSALESLFAQVHAPLHLTRTTDDPELAERWLEEFEGAGLDGVVAKPLDAAYTPGKRTMLKIKHVRTADMVLLAYRVHKSGQGVGSLLLGLYDGGELRMVGGSSAFTNAKRLELIDELAPLVERDADGEPLRGEGEQNRFSSKKDTSFVRLRPERVLEVKYDQMEGARLRHTAQFLRWRPDRDPESCTYDQLEVPADYDLGDVLS